MRQIIFGAACLVAGLILGVSFSGRPPTSPAPLVRADPPTNDARLASIEDRLQALNDRLRQPAPYAASATAGDVQSTVANGQHPTAPSPPDRRAPTPEEAGEHVRRLQQEVRQEHAAESVDTRWAPSARSAFDAHLATLSSAAGYEVLGASDCRSTSCLAQIRWPRCSQVHQGSRAIERIAPDESSPLSGCSTLLLQENPASGHEQDPCEGLIRVNCEHARMNGGSATTPAPRS